LYPNYGSLHPNFSNSSILFLSALLSRVLSSLVYRYCSAVILFPDVSPSLVLSPSTYSSPPLVPPSSRRPVCLLCFPACPLPFVLLYTSIVSMGKH
jgi:hypothetical protein